MTAGLSGDIIPFSASCDWKLVDPFDTSLFCANRTWFSTFRIVHFITGTRVLFPELQLANMVRIKFCFTVPFVGERYLEF